VRYGDEEYVWNCGVVTQFLLSAIFCVIFFWQRLSWGYGNAGSRQIGDGNLRKHEEEGNIWEERIFLG
jgi:hypothetical protein